MTWADLSQLGFSRTEAGSTVQFKQGANGGEVKNLTVSEAIAVKAGSVINITGVLVDNKTRKVGKDGKEITDYVIDDGKNKISVSKWGSFNDACIFNKSVFCSKVQVAEYQGKFQYLAADIAPVESEG
jgi:hypothetical protein